MSGIGHNSAGERLKSFIERVEKLNEEIDALGEDRKEVFSEAKDAGFDTKIMRKVIALRKKTKEQRDEEEALTDTYLQALGMI
jgi:uncharacterized protein (UPF0335 family)